MSATSYLFCLTFPVFYGKLITMKIRKSGKGISLINQKYSGDFYLSTLPKDPTFMEDYQGVFYNKGEEAMVDKWLLICDREATVLYESTGDVGYAVLVISRGF